MFDYLAAVSFVEGKNGFRIGGGRKFHTVVCQHLSALSMVVDLAVKYDRRTAAQHRLNTAFYIDNAQTPMAKADVSVDVNACVIRPAMFEHIAHSDKPPFIDSPFAQSNAIYSAHNR